MAFLEEIAGRLVDQGVGVIGTNIFLSSAARMPVGNGPYLTLTETGGAAPTRVHNKTSANTKRPSAQILVRASTEQATKTMIEAAYNALDGVYNTILGGTFYISITAAQEPTDMGLDPSRLQLVFNINAERQP